MAVSKREREAYESGEQRRGLGAVERVIEDLTAPDRTRNMSPSERAAYEKGREGQQLDKD